MFENCLDVHGTEHCTIRQGFQLSTKVIPGKKSSHRNLIDFFFIQDQSYGIHLIRVCKNGNTHLLFPRCFFKQGLHPGKIITGKKFQFHGGICCRNRIKTVQHVFKFQSFAQFIGFRSIGILHFRLFVGEFQRTVCIDGRKFFGKLCHIVIFTERFFRLVGLHFFQMLMGILNGTELHDHLGCGFFSNAWNSRNIIGTVTHQSFQFYDLRRRYLIFFEHFRSMIILNGSLAPDGLRKSNQNLIRGKLKKIPVSGKNGDIHAFRFTSSCNCAKKVICLISFQRHDVDPHGSKHLFDQRNLFPKFLRHGFSGSFISFVTLMPERRCTQVKGNGKVLRLLFFHNSEHNIQKSIYCSCMASLCIGKIRQAIKCPVQNTMSIDQ